MSYKVEAVPDSYAALGEGPHWDVARQSLYYVDLESAGINRYDFKQNKVYKAKIQGEVFASFILPIENKPQEFAVGCTRRAVVVQWDGTSAVAKVMRTLFEVQPDHKDNRINDAKTDPNGRFYGGTMADSGDIFTQWKGELYSWQAGGKTKVLKGAVGISNGLAWDTKAKKFYFIDTNNKEVEAYDYDQATGDISNRKVIFDLRKLRPDGPLFPDGMTVDTDGNIYVATFNGGTVFKVNPSTGKLLLEIKIPTTQITSVAFGGPNLDILYVTTADKVNQPKPAGTLFQVTGLNAKGYAGVDLKMSYKVEAVPDSYAARGEGPHWDVARQSLYYVDLESAGINRYDFKQNKVYKAKIEGEKIASFILPIENKPQEFAVGCEGRVVVVQWDGTSAVAKVVRTLFEVQPEETRINDAKADPNGRFFGGSMADFFNEWKGELYSWEAGGQPKVLKVGVGLSNGLAWDLKAKKFYYIDTGNKEVEAYDYDQATGNISNGKVIFDLRKLGPEGLFPDGMTVDTDGNIYVATFNGGTVFKVNPSTGKVLLEIKIPTTQISSVAFGGPNLDILYVTTADYVDKPKPAGTVFQVTGLNAKGLPAVDLKV